MRMSERLYSSCPMRAPTTAGCTPLNPLPGVLIRCWYSAITSMADRCRARSDEPKMSVVDALRLRRSMFALFRKAFRTSSSYRSGVKRFSPFVASLIRSWFSAMTARAATRYSATARESRFSCSPAGAAAGTRTASRNRTTWIATPFPLMEHLLDADIRSLSAREERSGRWRWLVAQDRPEDPERQVHAQAGVSVEQRHDGRKDIHGHAVAVGERDLPDVGRRNAVLQQ